jgi:hypothetical protein
MTYTPERTVFIGATGTQLWIGTPLFSDFNIHECNLMLFDPITLDSVWNQMKLQRHVSESRETPGTLRRRWEAAFNAISRWVEEGNTLLITVRQLPTMNLFISREKTISENPNSWEPLRNINLTPRTGNLVQPASAFAREFTPFESFFSYQYVVDGEKLVPLYKTSSVYTHNQETVAGFFRRGRGVIVFAPQPSNWHAEYLDAITRLREQQVASLSDLPEWADRFQNNEERAALERIALAERDLEDAHQRIEQEKGLIRGLNKEKVLYAGTDAVLVEETAKALREFGLAVVEGPHPRADLLVWDGTHLAAAEVKGLKGSAKEADFRQVNTWVAEVNRALAEGPEGRRADPVLIQYSEKLTELGIDVSTALTGFECQGLMIIATFRKTSLADRTLASFPDPVAKLIQRFGVAALTGLDLYCLLQEVRSDPTRKQKIAEELLTLRGVMPSLDWQQVITRT